MIFIFTEIGKLNSVLLTNISVSENKYKHNGTVITISYFRQLDQVRVNTKNGKILMLILNTCYTISDEINEELDKIICYLSN